MQVMEGFGSSETEHKRVERCVNAAKQKIMRKIAAIDMTINGCHVNADEKKKLHTITSNLISHIKIR